MSDLAFFSQEWCDAALEISNASERLYKGFKDASSFSHILVFEVTDKKLVTSVEYVSGYIKSWTVGDTPDTEAFARFGAELAVWRSAAEKKQQGSQLLMSGKVKLRHGPLQAAVENAPAFNTFLQCWGATPTDWSV